MQIAESRQSPISHEPVGRPQDADRTDAGQGRGRRVARRAGDLIIR